MSRKLFTVIFLVSFLLPKEMSCQDIKDIYYKTRKFAEMFLYGERKQDIGLQFGWKLDEDSWKPIGNGFTFLTEGLNLFDYDIEYRSFVEGKDTQWYINQQFEGNDAFESIPSSLYESQDLITWVGSSTDSGMIDLDVTMIGAVENQESGVIPCEIIGNQSLPGDSISFIALRGLDDSDLYFQIVNLTDKSLDISINNREYPCSPVGWLIRSTAYPGNTDVETSVSAIRMNGTLKIMPYSYTLLQFPTKPNKELIPPRLLP